MNIQTYSGARPDDFHVRTCYKLDKTTTRELCQKRSSTVQGAQACSAKLAERGWELTKASQVASEGSIIARVPGASMHKDYKPFGLSASMHDPVTEVKLHSVWPGQATHVGAQTILHKTPHISTGNQLMQMVAVPAAVPGHGRRPSAASHHCR
jgi:hypothetical protein